MAFDFKNLLNNFKKYVTIKNIVYAVLILTTVILFASLLAWASKADESAEITVIECTVDVAEGTRREYLVGQTVTPDGLALKCGDTQIRDCEVQGSTDSAGLKRLEITHQDGNTLYRGYFDINVFTIRHCDLNTDEITFKTDENGVPQAENDVLKLDLDSHPTEFNVENEQMPNVVTLDKSMYTIKITPKAAQKGFYDMTVMMGQRTLLSYTCVYVAGRYLLLDNENRVLKFDNVTTDSDAKLTLYVTTPNGANGALGIYMYESPSAVAEAYDVTYYNFKYWLEGWTSHFDSSLVNNGANIVDSILPGAEGDPYSDGMQVVVDGITFKAAMGPWHAAVGV